MNPIISIIVPVYNQERYLSRCLDSILGQTFTDFEVLCIDDKSTDSSYEIIEQYAQRDSRIIPLKNPGKGVSSARNFGLENAGGEYIGFVDSDDFIQPQMYEFLFKAITESGADFSYCRYKKSDGFVPSEFSFQFSVINAEELKKNPVDENMFNNIWNKLFKHKTVESINFEDYVIGEDSRFCVNAVVRITEIIIAYVDLPLYGYFTNTDSVTNQINGFKMYQNILTKYDCFNLLKNKYENVAYHYLEQGFFYLIKYKQKYGFKEKEYKRKINKLYRKYILTYLKSPYSEKYDKIYVIFSCFLPKIYYWLTKNR